MSGEEENEMNITQIQNQQQLKGMSFLKSALLVVGIFLVTAPAVDAAMISEISANFLVMAVR
jgi:hypothetical protein